MCARARVRETPRAGHLFLAPSLSLSRTRTSRRPPRASPSGGRAAKPRSHLGLAPSAGVVRLALASRPCVPSGVRLTRISRAIAAMSLDTMILCWRSSTCATPSTVNNNSRPAFALLQSRALIGHHRVFCGEVCNIASVSY